MSIQGSSLGSTNPRLRLLVITFLGIMAFGTALIWKQSLFQNQDYIYLNNEPIIDTRPDSSVLKSKNFQVQPLDASPAVEK